MTPSTLQYKYQLSDEQWTMMQPLIAAERSDKKVAGRTRMEDRAAMQAIFYVG